MDKALSDFLDYCKSNNRICPEPMSWNQLWELLLTRKGGGTRGQLSGPPIRAAWWHTTDSEKQNRFCDHIIWACNHGQFDMVEGFIRSLSEDQWHHMNE